MKTKHQTEMELLTEFIKWIEKTIPTNDLGYHDIQWPDTFSDGERYMDQWPELFESFLKQRKI